MKPQPRQIALKIILAVGAAAALALVLFIPGILLVKLTHGASALHCVWLFVAYIMLWVIGAFGLVRFSRHDAIWSTGWGICFLALLVLSWRL